MIRFLKSFGWDIAIVVCYMMLVDPPPGLSGLWLAAVRGACIGCVIILLDSRYERKEV